MTQNQQDTLWILDGSELINYVSDEVRKALVEMAELTAPIPYNKYNVKRMTDSIIENAVYNTMRNELGYVVTYSESSLTDVLKLPPRSEQYLKSVYKYISMVLYSILMDVLILNIEYHYFIKVMIVNRNIHIRITK
jgi:hypothetical protein